ncbi:ROK family protein [Flammeovirga sp. OC4]|uniref:ROK family protein n=1 Tax=Flammeovirga sp. OC4 TaxID=1382345 RepID=UPI00155DC1AB|nr:ROK family protein [Flammeovirga sp. OC4]
MKQFLGVDIGGTNVKFGVVDSDGNIIKKKNTLLRKFLKVVTSVVISQNYSPKD